ncbi:thaumatin-like protein 2 [Artemisia annua]|uniref:Thaumatin-like protein 2 n=1 Tax=Artemisia annua TaxID=35608 RepID=A0A2U1NZX3_ARTAN|nr:thaumatin-like protein 2 [Artemisia annua]
MAYHVNNFLISFIILTIFCFTSTQAANIDVINQCPYTVWAAARPGEGIGNETGQWRPGGGRRIETGQSWQLTLGPGTSGARIWGRTKCNFDANGRGGNCETGDCNNLLECDGYGTPPVTLAEFAPNQDNNTDFLVISLVDGFNIPMEFGPVSADASCKKLSCAGVDLISQCPKQLRAQGGCNNPCNVFNTDEYCCTPERDGCGPTDYSRYFKDRCPDAKSYPIDDVTSQSSCPGGTNYKVVFCP